MNRRTTPIVQTAGLCKTFKDFWRRPRVKAVEDLSLEIFPGQVFGLLGPNGSGKSTTIKMLLGLLYPTRGRIAVFGKAPTDVAVKARIGFLPEESYLYRFLNARETLDYYGRLFRLPPRVRKTRTDMLLDMVGLRHEAKRRIGEYSKGMARRIGLAQALINDPEFLILDEPTSGLDPIGTRQIKDVIRELGNKGKTILLSSHVLADVEDVCDQITILYGGRQRAGGDIKSLLSKEEFTQFTTPKLSEGTIGEVRSLLQRLEKKEIINVGTPTHRLEEFFIDVVEKAQRENVETSGARSEGALAAFLSESEQGDSVVDSLLASAAPEPNADTVPVVEAPPRPAEAEPSQLVEDLLSKAQKPQEPAPLDSGAAEPTDAQPASAPVKADRLVIDELLGESPSPPDKGDS